MNTPQQLFDLYSYIFAEPNIGISIARGWLPIFQKLCQDVDTLLGADKHGFHFIQCKEKLGSARWYWAMSYIYPVMRIDLSKTWADGMSLNGQCMDVTPPASIREQIGALIDAATAKTKHSCIVCGAPGAGDPQGGWFPVLCDVHARQRRLGNPRRSVGGMHRVDSWLCCELMQSASFITGAPPWNRSLSEIKLQALFSSNGDQNTGLLFFNHWGIKPEAGKQMGEQC